MCLKRPLNFNLPSIVVMAEICCGFMSDKAASTSGRSSSREARRKRMEIRRVKFVAGVPAVVTHNGFKKLRVSVSPDSFSHACDDHHQADVVKANTPVVGSSSGGFYHGESIPKFGVASVCGRRREMEDAVAIHPSFLGIDDDDKLSDVHYFGVYDGHGCSHVCYTSISNP